MNQVDATRKRPPGIVKRWGWRILAILQAALLILVGLAAVAVASRYGGRWLPFLLAGAAGWVLAQVLKAGLSLPLAANPATAAAMVSSVWFPVFAAVLPALAEELGKYVPLRWMRVQAREQALALGLGAGAIEAVFLALPLLLNPVAGTTTLVGMLISVWERSWAVTLHAGMATLDGFAACARRGRWLLAAMAAHFLADLPAGQYQRLVALRAPGVVTWLVIAEILVPLLALAALALGRGLWRKAGAAPGPAQ